VTCFTADITVVITLVGDPRASEYLDEQITNGQRAGRLRRRIDGKRSRGQPLPSRLASKSAQSTTFPAIAISNTGEIHAYPDFRLQPVVSRRTS
jgi:hypothetical protein